MAEGAIHATPSQDNRETALARDQVDRAYDLLCQAVRTSVQVPDDVIVAMTAARQAVAQSGTFQDPEVETRFWNAYGLLASIQPADRARRRYKLWFYVVLVLLVVCQLYYLSGSLVSDRLTRVETEWQQASARSAPAQDATQAVVPNTPEFWSRLRRTATAQANYDLARRLLPLFRGVKLPEMPSNAPFTATQAQRMADYMKLRGELDLYLLSLSGYILPLLYGLLGAFAFVLRKLSDPIAKLTYAHDTGANYTLRLHIGALGGLAVGWFINGNAPISGLGALSPLALAFAAGYGSDLLFAALDRVVGAFTTPAGAQASVRTETTYGGMTVRTETQREARVASGAIAAPAEDAPEIVSGPRPVAGMEARLAAGLGR